MTVDQCRQNLSAIRRRQGTDRPLIRVDFGGTAYRGRLARADVDHAAHASPFGILVLESPGLDPAPATILQIASIPPGGIREIDDK